MNPPIDSKDIEFALWHCAREPVRTPGMIQPHGALMAVHGATGQISHVSENISEFIRVKPELLLGREIAAVFNRQTRARLDAGLFRGGEAAATRDLGCMRFGLLKLFVTAVPCGRYTIFEFEVCPGSEPAEADVLRRIEEMIAPARALRDREELLRYSVETLRDLTGFDRVLAGDFDHEGNCSVRAEMVDGLSSLDGLVFPAWDIPPQARKLMEELPMRMLCDLAAEPVPILAFAHEEPCLDQTHSLLRAPSPVHRQYLRNMDLGGSMTLNIHVDGKLWGMISMHHREARFPDPVTRRLCRGFQEFLGEKLTSLAREEIRERLFGASNPKGATRMPRRQEATMAEPAADLLEDLRHVMKADGAALLTAGAIAGAGWLPTGEAALGALAEGVMHADATESTEPSPRVIDVAKDGTPDFGSVLALPLEGDVALCFFRRSRDRLVAWAGAPEKNIALMNGEMRITPRRDFDPCPRLVSGEAEPWSETDRTLAAAILASLRRSSPAIPEHDPSSLIALQGACILEDLIRQFAEPEEEGALQSSGPATAGASGTTCRWPSGLHNVLLLQSDGDRAQKMQEVLHALGVRHPTVVSTASDALAAVRAQAPDLAILDLDGTVGRTGTTLAAELRQGSVPLLFIHGGTAATRDEEAPILCDPIDAETLCRAVSVLRG